jgi:hypothetical protein
LNGKPQIAEGRGSAGRRLLVSTSEAALLNERQWTAEQIEASSVDAVMSACDLLIVHGGDDVETGQGGDANDLAHKVEALLRRGVSFDLHSTTFQTMYPPRWGVWENDTSCFSKRVQALTS